MSYIPFTTREKKEGYRGVCVFVQTKKKKNERKSSTFSQLFYQYGFRCSHKRHKPFLFCVTCSLMSIYKLFAVEVKANKWVG